MNVYKIILGIVCMMIVAAIVTCAKQPKSKFISQHTHWYGVVESVGPCYAGKSYYRCTVRVVNGSKPYTLYVDDFPGEYIGTGDRIGYQHIIYDDKRETWMRKNDRIQFTSVCSKSFACWDRDN